MKQLLYRLLAAAALAGGPLLAGCSDSDEPQQETPREDHFVIALVDDAYQLDYEGEMTLRVLQFAEGDALALTPGETGRIGRTNPPADQRIHAHRRHVPHPEGGHHRPLEPLVHARRADPVPRHDDARRRHLPSGAQRAARSRLRRGPRRDRDHPGRRLHRRG